jgi:hypothetical protein
MQLRSILNSALPKLAWIATVDRNSGGVILVHGPYVEVRKNFFIEGVWNGHFESGCFGETDCVFGSGGILNDESIRFVTSASTVDYLYYAEDGGEVTVSNSLPLLLARTSDALDPQCQDYAKICHSILEGINDYWRGIPTKKGKVLRQMYRNLDIFKDKISEADKNMPPRFSHFDDYENYLRANYALIAANARDAARSQPLEICSTQSKGYDTTAVNAIAREHGLDKVFTVTKGKSIFHQAPYDDVKLPDDDGSEIASCLALNCIPLDRRAYAEEFDQEYLYYCALHHNQDANLKGITKYMGKACLLLTGINGDVVWSRENEALRTCLDSSIRRGDLGGHGMSELRLVVGFIQLPLPFMGARQKVDIVRITESPDMDPWRLKNEYDRPIPRRIAENAGVARHLFGQSKMASAVIFPPPSIPYGKALRREFFDWLIDEKIMTRVMLSLWPFVRWVNSILMLKSERRFAVVYYSERLISKMIGSQFHFKLLWLKLEGALFCFCVNKTASAYRSLLKESSIPEPRYRLGKPPA